MQNIDIDENKLKELCEKHKLRLLILHGSYVKGNATEKSDIDVGILAKNKFNFDEYHSILEDFEGIFGDKFDPAFLNGAEPMINYHVAVAGKPLYESVKGAFLDYKIQSISRYMDTKKFRDLEKAYIKRAIGKET